MNGREHILLVEDDAAMRVSCRQALEAAGFEVAEAASPAAAEPILLREELDLVVTDLRMPGGGGLEVLRLVKRATPGVPVVLITAYPTVDSAVEAFRNGVTDYLLKPFTGDQLIEAVGRVLAEGRARDRADLLRRLPPPDPRCPGMIGSSEAFLALLAEIRRVAALEGSVLVTGETGSGKELVARAIHRYAARAAGPFVAVNCAALPEPLFESEMFGHEKGAFTGAAAAKPGLLEAADHGVLFLDEVCSLPAAAQAKLLRCIEERACRRVGGVQTRPVDVRLVAATPRDLAAEVREGRFREDLYYRLSALDVRVPPLRERVEDIPRLAVAFLDRLTQGREPPGVSGFSEEAFARLSEHPWLGNVRELQNVVQKAFARASGPLITEEDVRAAGAGRAGFGVASVPAPRRTAMTEFERRHLLEAVRRHEGNVTHAAQALGIHRTTLQRLMRKHGLDLVARR